MSTPTALLDACVLDSQTIRDLLLNLARTDLFRARWTSRINEEWTRTLSEMIPSLQPPDPDDRHVLAAAIVGGADLIITLNLDDFPKEQLEPFGIEAQHPDAFIARVIALNEAVACAAIRRMRERYRNPPMMAGEYVESLEKKGLSRSADQLRAFLDRI